MSIINLQRDAHFSGPEKTEIAWGAKTTVDETLPLKTDADSTVYDIYSSARCSRDLALTLGSSLEIQTFGLFMRPPGSELTPYRVKCRAVGNKAGPHFLLSIGYAEDAITGTDDEITFYQLYPFDYKLDELFLIEPQVTVGTAPIFFGISVMGLVTTGNMFANISVQRLATSPPQFSQSVS